MLARRSPFESGAADLETPLIVRIEDAAAVERARRLSRQLATAIGFNPHDVECIAIAVSELATNLLRYAEHGEIVSRVIHDDGGIGIEVESRDRGPGIADLPQAMCEGFSTAGGLGHGLSGAKRMMDDFQIESGPSGTHIRACKWLNPRSS